MKSDFRPDLIAGLSVAGLLLPQAVAYASIGGLAPQHALFATIIGLFVYAALGRSEFAIVSPTSSSAAIIGGVGGFAFIPAEMRMAAVYGVVILAGVIFIAAGAARLGRLSSFISRPVLSGFTVGLAYTIVIQQLPALLGVPDISGHPFKVLVELGGNWRAVAPTSALLGLGALVLLVVVRPFKRIPGALAALVLGIAAAHVWDLGARGVALVGAIDIVPDRPRLPDLTFEQWRRLAEIALPLVMVVFAESWGSMRSLALKHGETIAPDRELIALGAANLASGLIRGMPVGAGFSASVANEAAGAKTRASGLIAGIAICLAVAFGGNLIADVPKPVLAAVVIGSLLGSLDPEPLVRLFRLDRDQYIALAAALGVMLAGVVEGMLFAIALSLAAMVARLAQSHNTVLGRLRDTHDFVDARKSSTHVDPKIAVLRPNAPLFFVNSDATLEEAATYVESKPTARALILSLEETTALDSTAFDGLVELRKRICLGGRRFYLGRVKPEILDTLQRGGASDLASKDVSHWSVAGAYDQAVADLTVEEKSK